MASVVIISNARIQPTISGNARIQPTLSANAEIVQVITAVARIQPSIPSNARIQTTEEEKGRVYAIGGFDSSGYSSENASFDPFENVWTGRRPLVTPRTKLAVATHEFDFYAFGGLGLPTDNTKYDHVADTWTTKNVIPVNSNYAAGAEGLSNCETDVGNGFYNLGDLKSLVYLLGGRDTITNLANDLNTEYDPDTDTYTSRTAIPADRANFGCGAINNETVFVTGGDTGLDSNFEYDPRIDSWATRATMSVGRHELAATGNSDFLFAIDGNDSSGTSQNSVEKYEPLIDAWVNKAPPAIARGKLTSGLCVEDYEKIVAIGGLEVPTSCTTGTPTSLTETYDTAADAWVTKASMPNGRMDLGSGYIRGVRRSRVYKSISCNAKIRPENKYISGRANIVVTEEQYIYASGRIRPSITAVAQIVRGITARAWIEVVPRITAVARIAPSIPANGKIRVSVEQTIGGRAFIGHAISARAIVLNNRIRARARIRPVITAVARIRPRLSCKARVRPVIKATAWIKAVWEREITANAFVRPVITATAKVIPTIGADARISPTIAAHAKVVIWPEIPANGHILTEIMKIGKVYVSGGWRVNYDNKQTVHEAFEPLHDVWTTVQELPKRKAQHGVGTSQLQITLYSIGGDSSDTPTSPRIPLGEEDNLEYNPDTDTWTYKTEINPGRKNSAVTNATDFNGYEEIFSIGGRAKSTGIEIGNVDAYDPALDSWTVKSGVTARDSLAACTVVDNTSGKQKIYASGGENAVKTNESYDPFTDTWTTKADLNVGRQEHAATFTTDEVSNYVTVSGGLDVNGFPIGTIENYLDTTNTWTVDSSWTLRRDRIVAETVHSNTTYSPVAIFVGGGDYQNQCEEYMLTPVPGSSLTTKTSMPTGRADAGSGYILGLRWYSRSETISGTARVRPVISANAQVVLNVPLRSTARIQPTIGANGKVRPPNKYITAIARIMPVLPAVARIIGTIQAKGRVRPIIVAVARISPTIQAKGRIQPIIIANASIATDEKTIDAVARVAYARYGYALTATAWVWKIVSRTITANGRVRPSLPAVARVHPAIKAVARIQPYIRAVARILPGINATARIRPVITAVARVRSVITALARVSPTISSIARIVFRLTAVARVQPVIKANGRIKVPHTQTITASAYIRLASGAGEGFPVYRDING